MVKTGQLEELFSECGYPYDSLEENETVNIEDKNIEIASYDHKTNAVVFKKVLTLVRKHDAKQWELHRPQQDPNQPIIKGTEEHKVYDPIEEAYVPLREATVVMESRGFPVEVFAVETSRMMPVLDIEVEDTHCYFTNNILSHNTTGGNALKFYSSQRIDVRRIGGVKPSGSEQDDTIQFIANRTKAKIVKNKVSPPFKVIEFDIVYGQGINVEADIIDNAVADKIMTKSGAWYGYAGENVAQGKDKACKWLLANPSIAEEIKAKL